MSLSLSASAAFGCSRVVVLTVIHSLIRKSETDITMATSYETK